MNVLEHSVAFVSSEFGTVIRMQHLPAYIRQTSGITVVRERQSQNQETTQDYKPLTTIRAEMEERIFRETLLNSNSRTEAIRKLGISRRTFYKKLKEYALF
jgi:transcriptional regulator with PAS, ATPase and Fis domain